MDIGVANNQTYRNQYHFTDDFTTTEEEYPSINDQDKINQTIKENPYRSNVNIEGGEVVIQPDLTALFKAQGKRHSRGGMDVYLRPNSFVFSDFKDLAFDEDDHEIMELKEGGNFKKQNNTPAEVLKRNIDIKHYNTLVANLGDPKQDDLAKKSSSLMLEKYIQTLGNIAYLQESKKNFPDGLPYFSAGTAPVYDPSIKENVVESKQFAKYGGNIYRSEGGTIFDNLTSSIKGIGLDSSECPCGRLVNGECAPCSEAQLKELSSKAVKGTLNDVKGMRKIGNIKNTDYYHSGTDPMSYSVPKGVKGNIGSYQQWKNAIQSMVNKGATLEDLVKQGHGTKEGLSKLFTFNNPGTDKFVSITNEIPTSPDECPCGMDRFGQCIPCGDQNQNTPSNQDQLPVPNPVNGDGQGQKRADWQFTPWQKISQLYNWGQFANVKRYMPYRSRYNATYAEPSLLNPEQAVGDAKAMANQTIQSLGALNPIMRNAQAAATYGQALNTIPGIRAQYDNQNSQITNQFRQYNNQVRNNESMVNMQNDQNYYQQAVTARANFDNMRTFTANNAMNNVMRDVETNQKLAYNLLTQNNPAYNFDWNSGNFTRTNKSILDVQGDAKSDMLSQYADMIGKDFDKMDATQKINFFKALIAKGFTPSQAGAPNFFQKKGGKIRNPYKK